MTPGLRPRLLPLLIAGCWLPWQANAQVDELALRLSRQFDVPLRWDNVEGDRRDWVTGAVPYRDRDRPWHAVTLAPGDEITLQVPSGEPLRAVVSEGVLSSDALEFLLSNGSGLYLQQTPRLSKDGGSLLLDTPDDGVHLVRVRRSAAQAEPLAIGLFVARHEPLAPIAPYREPIPFAHGAVDLRAGNEAAGQRYWPFSVAVPVSLELDGDRRLLLEGRLRHQAREAAGDQAWRVRVWADDVVIAEWSLRVGEENRRPVFVDGRPAVLSQERRLAFSLPPGRQRIRIESDMPALLRLLEQSDPDYLLPGLNAPDLTARDVRDAGLRLRLDSVWRMSAAEAAALLADPQAEGAEIVHAGQRLAHDNRHREGGLLAAVAADRKADARRDAPELRREADAMRGGYSFYRDLLPRELNVDAQPRSAAIISPRPVRRSEDDGGLVVAAQHEADLLRRVESARFFVAPVLQAAPAVAAGPIILTSDVLFDTDQASLRAEGRAALRALLPQLGEVQGSVRIIGHTDSRASEAYNQTLSERRAAAVADYLRQAGLTRPTLQTEGRGESEPRADNDSAAGRAANRRVELVTQLAGHVIAAPRVLEYVLPERFSPSWLRLAVHRPVAGPSARLWLQFDDASPQLIEHLDSLELPPDDYGTTTAEAALVLLQSRHGRLAGTTRDGPYARHRTPELLVRAATLDLPLPSVVRRIRVWRDADDAGPPAWVALKYRAGRVFEWTEQGWRHAVAGLEPQQQAELLQQALRDVEPDSADTVEREIDSHWQALARAVRGAARTFSASVVAPRAALVPDAPTKAEQAGLDEGRRLATRGQWLSALEALVGNRQPQAAWLQIEALDRLGERFLAEQRLKQLMLHGASEAFRSEAVARLDDRFRRSKDSAALRNLHAAAYLQVPDAIRGARLATALLEDGDADLALTMVLVLPPEARPVDTVLEAAWREGWWQVFDDTVATLPAAQRALWQGHGELARGQQRRAIDAWRSAGEAGARLIDYLQAGNAIASEHRSELAAGPTMLDAKARWMAAHPGLARWQGEDRLFVDFAGTDTLYSIDRDLFFPTVRATAARPATLRVLGPQRLRIEARPLHPGIGDAPLEGWLRVRSPGRLWLEPVINNMPSVDLKDLGAAGQRPGRAVVREIELGTGWHELQVDGGDLTLLLRASLLRPALPLGTLAETLWDTVAPGSTPIHRRRAGWLGDCGGCLWLVDADASGTSLQHRKLARNQLRGDADTLGAVDFAALQQALPGQTNDVEATLRAAGRAEPLLASPGAGTARERLISQLWMAEQQPESYPALLAAAEALVAAHPEIEGAGGMMARLRRQSGWQTWDAIAYSAGLRALTVGAGDVEAPALRARFALLAPLAAHERRHAGAGRRVVSFENPAATTLSLTLQSEDVGLQPPAAMRVQVQLDDQPPETVTLLPGAMPVRREIRVPAGLHAIRIAIEEPLANQFLRIGLREAGGVLVDHAERFFHVARRAEPVRASIPGPAWLRIDEWVGDAAAGHIESEYRYVAGEWEELELPPRPGKDEGLYRLHLRAVMPEQAEAPARNTEMPASEPVAPPPVRIRDLVRPGGVTLTDGLPLGGQEDGTWSVGLSRNRSFESEAADGGGAPLRYGQLSASYRHFDEDRREYFRGELLSRAYSDGSSAMGFMGEKAAREYQHGNSTLGLRAEWFKPRGRLPVDLELGASLFTQRPKYLIGSADRAWAARIDAAIAQTRPIDPKTEHRPTVSAFARVLEVEYSDYVKLVDPDVFSRTRSRHRWGLRIADTLTYRPWLDSEAYVGGGITSNAALEPFLPPDRVDVRAGWRQLMGPVHAAVEYRGVHYFDDESRRRSLFTDELKLDLTWEKWTEGLHRHELGLRYALRLSDGRSGLELFWNYHLGNGRGYRDFRPGETPFRDLRERALPVLRNNVIRDE